MEEEGRDPENGSVELLQAEKKVIAILNGHQVVVILLQNAGVEGGKVGFPADVLLERLGRGKIATENKIGFIDFLPTLTAHQDPAVSDNGANVVVFVLNGRDVGKQRPEVIANGENVFMAGVIVVHQLSDPNHALGQRKVLDHVNVLQNLLPENEV